MANLGIKHFGPIRNGYSKSDGCMDFSPVTLFIGNQATGKSTVAKVYSTCSWLEKAFIRGDSFTKNFSLDDFIGLLDNQGIKEYFTPKTQIKYIGEAYTFLYNKKDGFSIKSKKTNNYHRPKIMYVPAERNLISVLASVRKIKELPKMLSVLLDEYDTALGKLDESLFSLPVSNLKLKYNKSFQTTNIVSSNGVSVPVHHASSGIQSVVPLSLVSEFLSNEIVSDIPAKTKTLSSEQRELIKKYIDKNYNTKSYFAGLKEAFDRLYLTGSEKSLEEEYRKTLFSVLEHYFNTCFINIVEEPELNLFPDSQAKVLYDLLRCLNKSVGSQLVITTHSPYLLSYLTICAKAMELKNKSVPELEIEKIVPIASLVDGKDISIYETLADGSIKKIEPYENLPSDNNVLNEFMEKTNESFAQLLELEEEYCE